MKHVWDIYAENYKMLVKGFQETANKWRDAQCSWNEILDLGKIKVFPSLSYRFKSILIKI